MTCPSVDPKAEGRSYGAPAVPQTARKAAVDRLPPLLVSMREASARCWVIDHFYSVRQGPPVPPRRKCRAQIGKHPVPFEWAIDPNIYVEGEVLLIGTLGA
jgi:hypothetical protein